MMYHFSFSYRVHTEQDPYVDAIGGIEYNIDSDAFVVSGYTESVTCIKL